MQGMTIQVEGKITIENIKEDTGDSDADKASVDVYCNLNKLNYDENCKLLSEDDINADKNWKVTTQENIAENEGIEIDIGSNIELNIAMSQLITSGIDPEYTMNFAVKDSSRKNKYSAMPINNCTTNRW